MSRIHEALKRAEQERGGSTVAVDPSLESAIPQPTPSAQMQAVIAVPATNPVNGDAAPNQFTLDALLAQSRKTSWRPDVKTMLFFNADEHAPGTEQFRTLRSRLNQVREKTPLKKILVTSALPQEGKSFVAANLAQVIVRQQGCRALLIEADLRRPRLHAALGTTAGPGLADYLMGEGEEFSIMQQGPMENLFFIAGGGDVSNPMELLANGRLRILLQRVEALFDWIIVDSPPAVTLSDASLLANFCDGVLMVVKSTATPFDVAKRARREFDGKMLIGVVLNGVETNSVYNHHYYGAYEKKTPEEEAASQKLTVMRCYAPTGLTSPILIV